MVAHPEPAIMTVEEYLALEQTSQVKHEYSHGHVYAMSGGTVAHDRIANNVRTALDNHIGDGPCMVLGPDVCLQVSETVYCYPDAMGTSEDWRQ
jgi:Uma2 family endonuclease